MDALLEPGYNWTIENVKGSVIHIPDGVPSRSAPSPFAAYLVAISVELAPSGAAGGGAGGAGGAGRNRNEGGLKIIRNALLLSVCNCCITTLITAARFGSVILGEFHARFIVIVPACASRVFPEEWVENDFIQSLEVR